MKMLGYKALVLLISLHFWGPCGASYSSDADIAGSASFIGQNGSSEFQLKGPGFTDDARGPADSIGLPPGAPIEGVAAPGEGDEFGPFQPEVCRPDNSFEFVDTAEPWEIFDQLSPREVFEITDFMVGEMGFFYDPSGGPSPEGEFPTTRGPNYIYRVDLLDPPKAQALDFLDCNGPRPQRFAKVIVIRPANTPKDIMEFKVGPLPLAPPTESPSPSPDVNNLSPRPGVLVEKLVEDGAIPFKKRPSEGYNAKWTEDTVARVMYFLKDLLLETVGHCYGFDPSSPERKEETERECGTEKISWLTTPALYFYFSPDGANGEENFLHPIPLSFKIDETEEDIDQWRLFDFEFCNQGPFGSADELLSKYSSGSLNKCPALEWNEPDYDRSWGRTDLPPNPRPGSKGAGPRTFEPEGSRYNVKSTSMGGHHFTYDGWEGHIGVRDHTGVTLHDIRFKGERIVYELSLQEQYVAYSGYGGSGQSMYFDSAIGLGLSMLPLRRGLDCPEQALYLPIFIMGVFTSRSRTQNIDAICIFEEDSQITEWRHTHLRGSRGPQLNGVRRSMLVVRTVATVANYDYIYDIRFLPDASIQVDVRMAGYIVASYYGLNGETYQDDPFGVRVHEYAFGKLHDHLSGWKVDIDILGTSNTIRKQEVKVGTWEEALKTLDPPPPNPGWHGADHVKYVETSEMDKEFGHKINVPGNTIWSFVNKDKLNRWGQPRGYMIHHGMTTAQLLPDSHPFVKSMAWTKYNLAVTKHKDREPRSHAAHYDASVPDEPVVNFDNFIDGEGIVDEDLVGWVMVGVQHLPHSDNLPVISNFGTSFHIKPYNYFERLPSMDASNPNNFTTCAQVSGNLYEYFWLGDTVTQN